MASTLWSPHRSHNGTDAHLIKASEVPVHIETGRGLQITSNSVLAEFLGATALTRQPNAANTYRLEELTAVTIAGEHVEHLVMSKPLLLQDLGRIIDERRNKVSQLGHHAIHHATLDTLGG